MIDFNHGVALRKIYEEDLENLRYWRNDIAIRRWSRQSDLISETDQKKWFAKQNDDPSTLMYVVTDTNKTNHGVVGFSSYSPVHRSAEFSIYIRPDHQKNGVGKQAMKTLLDHGFKNLNLHSIWGESFFGNPAMKLFRGLGFQDEGLRRQCYFKDGKYHDCHVFSILESEWKI